MPCDAEAQICARVIRALRSGQRKRKYHHQDGLLVHMVAAHEAAAGTCEDSQKHSSVPCDAEAEVGARVFRALRSGQRHRKYHYQDGLLVNMVAAHEDAPGHASNISLS